MTGKKTAAAFYIAFALFCASAATHIAFMLGENLVWWPMLGAVVCAVAMLALWPRLKKRGEEAEEKAAGNEKKWEIIIEDGEKNIF